MSLLPELWREISAFLSLQDLQNLRLSSHFLYNGVTETLYCRYGDRILLRSAEEGHIETVVKMLKRCVHPDSRTIVFACKNGHLSVVKLLLEDTRIDPAGLGAIHFAMENGHDSVVKLLRAHPRVIKSVASEIDVISEIFSEELSDPRAASTFSRFCRTIL